MPNSDSVALDYFHKNSERNINVVIQLLSSAFQVTSFSYLILSTTLCLLIRLGGRKRRVESEKGAME